MDLADKLKMALDEGEARRSWERRSFSGASSKWSSKRDFRMPETVR